MIWTALQLIFFNLEKKTRSQNLMLHLKRPDGDVTTEPSEMRKMAMEFYEDVFSAADCSQSAVEEMHRGLPTLNAVQAEQLDSDITLEEITIAVQQLSLGRSPGIDGLSSEFYKCFWELLKKDLHDVFKDSFNSGTLPTSCTRAVLSLLPKKGDLGLLKNWRPVSLLCTDYKILSKCLSNRLKHFMDSIIHFNQAYCIPDRTIMDNLFLTRDVIDMSAFLEVDLGLLSIDKEKAFDRVDHVYLFKTLKAFGVGDSFISWVKLLYSGAAVVLKVGGRLSRPVTALRGIRQGCPLSGQLYSLSIKPLLNKLRHGLVGLEMENKCCVVLSAYADDVTVFIKQQKDVEVLIQNLSLFERASSAKVNWAKCEGYVLGQWEGTGPLRLPAGLQWNTEGIKLLGFYQGNKPFQKKKKLGGSCGKGVWPIISLDLGPASAVFIGEEFWLQTV